MQCTADQFQTVAATKTSQRQCQDLRTCQPPLVETVQPTATSDRLCCSANHYFDLGLKQCLPITPCNTAFEFETVPSTGTSDVLCEGKTFTPQKAFVCTFLHLKLFPSACLHLSLLKPVLDYYKAPTVLKVSGAGLVNDTLLQNLLHSQQQYSTEASNYFYTFVSRQTPAAVPIFRIFAETEVGNAKFSLVSALAVNDLSRLQSEDLATASWPLPATEMFELELNRGRLLLKQDWPLPLDSSVAEAIEGIFVEIDVADRRQQCALSAEEGLREGPCVTKLMLLLLLAEHTACPRNQLVTAPFERAATVSFVAPVLTAVSPVVGATWTTNVPVMPDSRGTVDMQLPVGTVEENFYYVLQPAPLHYAAALQCQFSLAVRIGASVQANGIGHLYLQNTTVPDKSLVLDYLVDSTQASDGGAALSSVTVVALEDVGFSLQLRPVAGELFTVRQLDSTEFTVRVDFSFCKTGAFPATEDGQQLVPMRTDLYFNNLDRPQPAVFSGPLSGRTADNRCFRMQANTEVLSETLQYSSLTVIFSPLQDGSTMATSFSSSTEFSSTATSSSSSTTTTTSVESRYVYAWRRAEESTADQSCVLHQRAFLTLVSLLFIPSLFRAVTLVQCTF